ncbi:hypothetical protein DSLASN_33740 [Desulfoluna limicola]|uniref:ADP-ribosylglycohydrolase n=1 Tax=Desulfoluna limicola TaxID=2810562 RepID=A0ABM7PJK8_9BACT|nr:ADP-ribosylglycohydrolase family protein [Desulfoluna limicola]BCS97742.1 hypothetical protein DSLASN_33740 [Desulfoluna limicola]
MIGSIIGNYIGSVFEQNGLKSYNLQENHIISHLSHITGDSVLLCATAEAMLDGSDDFPGYYRHWAERFPNAGYGEGVSSWLHGKSPEGQSSDNGAAARSGVLGYLNGENDVLELAEKSAACSHNHPEGIAGARAMAWTVWALRQGISVDDICQQLTHDYGYAIDYDENELHNSHTRDSSARHSVPLSIYIALKSSTSYEACMRTCLWIGGDTDSIMAMAGLLKSQQCAVQPDWELKTKQWLWKNAQPVLQAVERFENTPSTANV